MPDLHDRLETWLTQRGEEPSTWIGIVFLFGALGGKALEPSMAHNIAETIAQVCSVLLILMPQDMGKRSPTKRDDDEPEHHA